MVVSEPREGRRELAAAVGATGAVAPDELIIADFPMTVPDDAYDVVLECSGHDVAMEAGLAQLRAAGTLVLVGAGVKRPRWDPNRILLNELHVTGAFRYDDGGCEAASTFLPPARCRPTSSSSQRTSPSPACRPPWSASPPASSRAR